MTCLENSSAPAESESRFVLPVSAAQRRLWIQEQLVPGTAAYNVAAVLRLSGPLDGGALENSLCEIIARHEVLRTTFGVLDGRPVQLIAPVASFELPITDLRHLDEAARSQAAAQLTSQVVDMPFDLSRGPLVRAQLLRLAGEEHVFPVAMHHIAGDGWSVAVFFRELAALYGGSIGKPQASLPDLQFQYADFAVWQEQWLRSAEARNQADYWRRQLSGAPPFLRLPADYQRPETQAAPVSCHRFSIGAGTVHRLECLARSRGATLFMVALTSFAVALHYLGGEQDIVVGTDIANRNRLETENLIGFFANQLALRVSLAGDPAFEEMLDRARETTLGAYAHQDLPFDTVVEQTAPERTLHYSPLFQVKLVLQNAPAAPFSLPGLSVRIEQPEPPSAKFDLLMNLTESGADLDGSLYYRPDLFAAATAVRIAGLFQHVCELGIANPLSRLAEICRGLATTERKRRVEEEAKALSARRSNLATVRRKSL